MINCPNCNHQNADGSEFCINCGSRIPNNIQNVNINNPNFQLIKTVTFCYWGIISVLIIITILSIIGIYKYTQSYKDCLTNRDYDLYSELSDSHCDTIWQQIEVQTENTNRSIDNLNTQLNNRKNELLCSYYVSHIVFFVFVLLVGILSAFLFTAIKTYTIFHIKNINNRT